MWFDRLIGFFGFKSREAFWSLFKEGIRFCIVGVINTVIFYIIYLLFLYIDVNVYISYIIAFVVATFHSYILGNLFVFKTKHKETGAEISVAAGEGLFKGKRFVKVYVAYGFTIVLGLALVWFDVNILGLTEEIAPLINLFVTTPVNFLINKFWAYKD